MGAGWLLCLGTGALALAYAAYRRGRSIGRDEARGGAGQGALAAQLAHAINSPLCALLGTAQLSLETEGRDSAALERILSLGRRVSATVQRMLDLGRGRPLECKLVTAPELIDAARAELADACKASGVELSVRVEPQLPPFLADPVLLLTALVGIAENAVDAQPEGGEIALEVRRHQARLRFIVSDSGPGFPPELGARVLDPFVTTKPGGAGLGLAIAHRVALEHGGALAVDAAPGCGARVTLDLPLQR